MVKQTHVALHVVTGFISILFATPTVQFQLQNRTPAIFNTPEIFGEHQVPNSLRLASNLDSRVGENYDLRDDGYWPCPDPADIHPCVCTPSEDDIIRDMDCSAIASDQDLAIAFAAEMPFHTYRTLTISGVKSDSFNGLNEFSFGINSFEKVIISNTSLRIIEDGTFAASEEYLTSLILSNNRISAFPFETLPTMLRLTELYLDSNNLTGFNNLESESLGMITLSNNVGLNIETSLILSLPNLTSLYIEECGLTNFPPDLLLHLPIIEVLSIARNKIETLFGESIYAPDSKWKLVSFSDNPIDTVEENFLSEMLTTGKIEMSDASLGELDELAWRPHFQSVQDEAIDLEGNPLRCGCDMAWLFNEATNFYTKLTPGTACSDGTLVHSLPADAFEFHCS